MAISDARGRRLDDATVRVKQRRHQFLFGANCFMLDGYTTPAANRRYREALLEVCNSAVVPFYWSDLEPQPGAVRFKADSPPVPRRPPADVAVDFCRKHDLVAKGHCLVWHQWLPSWLSKDRATTARQIQRRIQEIAQRYRDSIVYWDVVNEPMEKHLFPDVTNLGDDYIAEAFGEARRAFLPGNQLYLNEATTYSWRQFQQGTTGLKLLLENLLCRGLKVDGLGLQYHLFFYDEQGLTTTINGLTKHRDTLLNPQTLRDCLDCFAAANRPIHISEISLPTYPDHPEAEALQAELLTHLYRLWFSHPAVGGIYWWNLADGSAHGTEGKLRAGLLREDLTPKPAYHALRRLIQEEWHTDITLPAGTDGHFRAFYGDYEVIVDHRGASTTHEVKLSKSSAPGLPVQITLPAPSLAG